MRLELEHNAVLGLWLAFVSRAGEVLRVVVDASRDSAVAAADAWMTNSGCKAR